MGKKSRAKGCRGEREVCALDAEYGFESVRTAPLQAGHGDKFNDVACEQWPLRMFAREVKLYERTPVTKFVEEYVIPERPGYVPSLVYRDRARPWIVCLQYTDLLKILCDLRDTKKELGDLKMQFDPPFGVGT